MLLNNLYISNNTPFYHKFKWFKFAHSIKRVTDCYINGNHTPFVHYEKVYTRQYFTNYNVILEQYNNYESKDYCITITTPDDNRNLDYSQYGYSYLNINTYAPSY